MTPTPASAAPPSRFPVLGCFFALSLLGNLFAGLLILLLCIGLLLRPTDTSGGALPEKYHSGYRSATDKVAIVTLDGIIMEGALDYVHKQLDQVDHDTKVKAVVVRINSPGGSITASDDLYRRIARLKNGEERLDIVARPVIVSMGSLAASGGYYVAAPADTIFAERTTMTGSIGVYASFPNLKDASAKVGFHMNTLKAGEIKDSASLFRDMTPHEQQVLQDMVNDAYVQFLDVVEKGRPKLTRTKMLERFHVTPVRVNPQQQGDKNPYERYRADGGVFTAAKAKELGLVDDIGTLDDAVEAAAKAAQIDSYYQAIKYQRTLSLSQLLLGVRSTPPSTNLLDPDVLQAAFSPKVWYLAPGHEAEGLAALAKTKASR
jgi:protease-4